jgi:hypothetical protein
VVAFQDVLPSYAEWREAEALSKLDPDEYKDRDATYAGDVGDSEQARMKRRVEELTTEIQKFLANEDRQADLHRLEYWLGVERRLDGSSPRDRRSNQ